MTDIYHFLLESNKIEGIDGVRTIEREATDNFLTLPMLGIGDVANLVNVYTNMKGRLRDRPGMDVMVGNHYPERGGTNIRQRLGNLLDTLNEHPFYTPFLVHCAYECLHPFMDGNGRSGRAVWLWHMKQRGQISDGITFLHQYYYQSLEFMQHPNHKNIESLLSGYREPLH